ncbi:MAG: hypothetical protein ACN6QT_01925 [Burkholderia contaminans]|uniref:Uncharacterized protein n=1 Tax=Burkholderia contaminans TaxID=488447 RepID=A0AAP4QWL7_9BURK|nr:MULTISPECIES: hypothetical protein [Burkholderia]MBD1412649.1 hypothetical protein [Burkholderia contaminans]MBH9665893.1 hypothetical protein [Burkholderia contaminans]MBH9674557.1 hypothetical protein [Burkholderia contaminans]MBH9704603.1 hypothetical protein [Burkholderia contaminans]MBH9718938.1 hypothetical protein [Burkholderia contaminans]
MQRTLRLHIQVSHVENGGRMIDGNVRVLPDGTARRRARGRANEQTAQAERRWWICVTDRDTLPRFTRNPVGPLFNIAPPIRRPRIPLRSHSNRSFPARFRTVDRTNRPPFVRLTILYSPLATLLELALAESRRSDHHCRNAVPNVRTRPSTGNPPRCMGRVAGGPHRADLLSAPYPGIVVAARPVATIRIAPRPAPTPNVELVTP